MDHAEAIRLHAVERYCLGDLHGPALDGFEEHFFECPECAEGIRTTMFLADNASAELQTGAAGDVQPDRSRPDRKADKPSWRDWFHWRQPAFVIPALALVVVSVGWLRDREVLADALNSPQAFTNVPLDVARGERPVAITRSERFFGVSFYIDSDTESSYAIEINGNGVRPYTIDIPQQPPGKTYNVLLPSARYKPGRYTLTIKGGPGTDGRLTKTFSLNLE